MFDFKKKKQNDVTLVVRQEKEYPDDWHIVAQTRNPIDAAKIAKQRGMKENTAFGIEKGGSVFGNKTSFFVMSKDQLQEGFNEND